MSGALFRNVTAQLIRRNAAASDPFGRTGTVPSDLRRLQSRPYFRSNQLFGRVKQTPPSSSGFCSSSSSSSSSVGFVGWYLELDFKNRHGDSHGLSLSQQTITKEKTSSESYDLVRTARMGAYGLLILGPVQHQWFGFMSRLFPKQDFITTIKKMAMGQTVYGPTIMVIFLSFNALLQGEGGSDILARLKRDLLPVMLNCVMYWPVCDFITFKFFPVHLQPLVSNSFSYVWSIYMTYMGNREKPAAISS
ncbi:hypothetical protein Bca101_065765 [Brassica carinata]